uniref:Ribosomal protein S6 kinase related b n=1 Tax=Myripristis murdjan TaxID=586833 RepID=A0A667XPC6_9TELE
MDACHAHIIIWRKWSAAGHLRLADFGLSRRLERGGRAFTICGTIQYMAPEVLSGGPYNHAADWWSLGILLFSLVTGKFPVPPEADHCSMLRKVRCFPYEMPLNFSPPLALLITELLCKTPSRRLRTLDRFKRQTFFHGTTFDLTLLQRQPVQVNGCLPVVESSYTFTKFKHWLHYLLYYFFKYNTICKQTKVICLHFRYSGDTGAERET